MSDKVDLLFFLTRLQKTFNYCTQDDSMICIFCVNESTRCTPDAPYDSDPIKLVIIFKL